MEKSASEKKIIKDVFHKGDEVFNSGNILINYLLLLFWYDAILFVVVKTYLQYQ